LVVALTRSSILLIFILLATVSACAPPAPDAQAPRKGESRERPARQSKPTPAAAATPSGPLPPPPPLASGLKAELVADGLQLPANLTFAPDGRLFLTEVTLGTVRVIERGNLLAEPFAKIEVSRLGEQGLLGLALHPEYPRSPYVYAYYSQPRADREGRGWRNRVVRLTDTGGKGADPQVILDDLPINNRFQNAGHNGGRLAFGPDGKLYVTVGDVGVTATAQDKGKLTGKLLRINPDGSVPADNPFPGSSVYALGLRNSYGITFHPLTGVPYVTDNGPSGHDEVNRIQPGGNYGSPEVNGIRKNPRYLDPLWESYAERGGIAGLTFYTGDLFPQYRNDLLFCIFVNGRLRRLRLEGTSYERVEAEELLSEQCNLDVVTGPEGAIYFSSFDKVQRLVPAG
jgi:glucose/arabinose dehydrogenase